MVKRHKKALHLISLWIAFVLIVLGLISCSYPLEDANDKSTEGRTESFTEQRSTEVITPNPDDKNAHLEDSGEYPQFMIEGERVFKWEEGRPTEEELDAAARLSVYDSCTIQNSKGELLRVNMSAGQIYGDIDIYEADLLSDELYVSGAVNYNGVLVDGLYLSLIIEDDDNIVICFDSDVEKFKLEYENSSKKRISYCGTGLREIKITDETVVLRGDVVISTEEDQSDLDSFDRMHVRAPGREIVIEPYVEK